MYRIASLWFLIVSTSVFAIARPQEPKKPYPYAEEDVSFTNAAAGITLSGTLTLPEKGTKPFPTVLLISGTGAMDRNQEVHGHKSFLVLADHLTRQGIACLRVDKRGVGKSSGSLHEASIKDFAQDALAGIAYLKTHKQIDSKRIGVIGHSEGGLVAPIVASKSQDVAFTVLMGAPGVNGEALISAQQTPVIQTAAQMSKKRLAQEKILRKKALSILKNEENIEKAQKQLDVLVTKYLKFVPDVKEEEVQAIKRQLKTINKPWFRLYLSYEPADVLKEIKVPVLVLGAEKDTQIPPEQNLTAIEKALEAGGNSHYTAVVLPGLNHHFQTCKTGSIGEYAEIEETFAPTALNKISTWINQIVEYRSH